MPVAVKAPDLLIIGAGAIGCAIALRVAQAGMQVTVLERRSPGRGASAAAGGMLAAQLEASRPGPLFDLCLESRSLYPNFAAELEALSDLKVDYLPSGGLHAAFTEASLLRQAETVAWQKAAGLKAELLSAAEARALEPALSEKVLGASFFPDDHQIDNRKLMRALEVAATRAGVHFRRADVATLDVRSGQVVGVVLTGGEPIAASAVVLAAGSWSSELTGVDWGVHRVEPVRGQMLELRPPSGLLHRLVFSDAGYLIPRRDGRLLAGSTSERVGFDERATPQGQESILALATALCPSLAGVPVADHWAGLRPFVSGGLPVLGRGPVGGLFLALGHFRNGILLTPVTAERVTAQILGTGLDSPRG